MNRLEEIQARVDAVRAGPWTTTKYPAESDVVRQTHWVMCEDASHSDCAIAQVNHLAVVRLGHATDDAAPTADFIAHAREDVPWLLARVRTLEAGLADITSMAGQEVRVGMAADTRIEPPFAPVVLNQIEQRGRAALAGDNATRERIDNA